MSTSFPGTFRITPRCSGSRALISSRTGMGIFDPGRRFNLQRNRDRAFFVLKRSGIHFDADLRGSYAGRGKDSDSGPAAADGKIRASA